MKKRSFMSIKFIVLVLSAFSLTTVCTAAASPGKVGLNPQPVPPDRLILNWLNQRLGPDSNALPCCSGIDVIAQRALQKAQKNIIIKDYTISINGQII